ncbi:MAG: hemolysin family protein [Acidobacteria bacterium]|nr:hemolysin family protein [Acidobacteriota bacterium]MCA1620571.1 hemolysin family protein [Acidobacteriota bacterium]
MTALYLLLVLFLVLANGFFVASEFALVGVRRSRVETLAASGSRNARRLLGLLDHLNAYISATQLGITMASLALGWIGEPVVAHMLEEPLKGRVSETALHTISFAVAFVVITFLHIVLGELAPKTLALERAERTALAIALPMELFYKLFRWPIRLLDWAGTRTVRLFGLHPSGEHGSIYTEEELRGLIDVSRRSGQLKEEEQRLLEGVFEFSDAEVREALVPRTEMVAVPASASLEEARELFRTTGYSRIPVYRERLDDVVGVLFRKDVDMGQARGGSLESLARPPAFIPASASLGDALKQMQSSRVHLVFVVDEHGGLEGILTLEDLLEEIVGEIDDEYDEEVRKQIAEQPDGSFVLEGKLAVRDANRRFGLDLPEDAGYTTVAGFLLAEAGRILTEGEEVKRGGATFRVERVERRRIRLVRFTPEPGATDGREAETSNAALSAFLLASSAAARAGLDAGAWAETVPMLL